MLDSDLYIYIRSLKYTVDIQNALVEVNKGNSNIPLFKSHFWWREKKRGLKTKTKAKTSTLR